MKIRIKSHSERKKLVASCSESRVNPFAQLLKKINHPVDEVSPVSNDVSPVGDEYEVDQCEVLISKTVLKTIQHLSQLNLSI